MAAMLAVWDGTATGGRQHRRRPTPEYNRSLTAGAQDLTMIL
jgi:hypothetical protein